MPVATYDAWKLSGPPEPKPRGACLICENDLYRNDHVVMVEDGFVCSKDCLVEYALENTDYFETTLS